MVDSFPRRLTRGARGRSVAACADESGDTLIEVVIAALIVGLIAAAIFTGFSAVAHISGGQRDATRASSLAQQDEERLRGLTVNELSSISPSSTCSATAGLYGNTCYTQTIDNVVYTITSTSKFISAASGNSACSTSGTADYIETASKVSWGNSNDGRQPVTVHSLISPPPGGGLTVSVTDTATPANPIAGVTITVQGPGTGGPTKTLTTDSGGCAVFGNLLGGTYTVTESDPGSGYSPQNGISTQSSMVAVGFTSALQWVLSQTGAIQASFSTTYNGSTVAATDDTFVAENSGSTNVYGTPGTFVPTVTTPSTVNTGAYSVYAGECTGDAPPSPTSTTVASAATTPVTIPEPAMLVNVYGGVSAGGNSVTELNDTDPSITYYSGSAHTTGTASADGNWAYEHSTSTQYLKDYYQSDAHYDGTAGDKVTFTFTGNFIEWLGPTSSNYGYANVAIDGTTVATNVDGYSATPSDGNVVMFSDILTTGGSHTLTITVNGTDDGKPSAGNHQHYVAIDAIVYGNNPTLYDDSNTTALTYNGSWNHGTGYTGDYNQTESFSNTAGNYMSVTFTGTSVFWIGNYYSNHGIATVYLDGTQVATVDSYASTSIPQQVLYQATNLSNTSHTLKIVVSGTKDAAASAAYVSIDAIIVGSNSNASAIDDDSNLTALAYTGSWTHATGFTGEFNSTESYSNTTGNFVSVTFTGTSVAWIGSDSSNHGIANVSIDGTQVATVDSYGNPAADGQTLYSVNNLTNATHTLKIAVSGTKNAASSGFYVSIDAIIVGAPALLSTQPNITLTDTGCSNHETYPPEQIPTATGGALVNPGEPYGTFTVCADNGTNKNFATASNTAFYTGNPVIIDLSPGAAGLTSGTCT
jgi:Tfp pilus assembly protein PilE